MQKRFYTFLLLMLCSLSSIADEGMWLPLHIKRLNEADMQKMGLQLTAEEIYSINNSSLKDAIVSLGGFCTAEVISSNGLMLTNHHCAYGSIQSHSTVENDYLSNGFWAENHEAELPNEGLYARFLVRMEDVTKPILSAVNAEMDEQERQATIAQMIQKMQADESANNDYDVVIKSFFNGNEYYMFVYETYYDVRLVGAPPSSIGKYGGDTDNWMWPRHTGDFALMRVYMNPDGTPSKEYDPKNVPMKAKYHLPVSLDGVQEGDFAMVMGYPGSTDRYLTSFGVNQALEVTNPTRVKIREKKLDILKEDMDADEEVRIKYASKYAQVSNYWKYFIGQSKGLKNLEVPAKKEALEAQFKAWIHEKEGRKEIYGDALQDIKIAYDSLAKYNKSYLYMVEAWYGTEILYFASRFAGLQQLLEDEEATEEKINATIESLKKQADKFYKDYNASTDQKIMAALMEMYFEDVDPSQHPIIFKRVEKKYKGNFEKWADRVFDNSMFADKEKLMAFLNDPKAKELEEDPAYRTSKSILGNYRQNIAPQRAMAFAKLDKGNRLFVRGIRLMNPDKKYYPDANSTMRLTFGQVQSYEPRDGVKYKLYTTLEGVMEKKDPTNPEFIVPVKLETLYNTKNYGKYAAKDGKMHVGFITNNDITGGNSGSPVINGKGELIGTAFDGNWEAMSGDIAFEPELQRCINVDIRYILFIIDKYAGAGHLVEEMTLVSAENTVEADVAE